MLMKVEIWCLVFDTKDGLFGDGFSFFGFCRPWYVKHKSLDQERELFDRITSLMRSFRASAAAIRAPLGIWLITDIFDLHVFR